MWGELAPGAAGAASDSTSGQGIMQTLRLLTDTIGSHLLAETSTSLQLHCRDK